LIIIKNKNRKIHNNNNKKDIFNRLKLQVITNPDEWSRTNQAGVSPSTHSFISSDLDYCNRINAEYETIKNTVLKRSMPSPEANVDERSVKIENLKDQNLSKSSQIEKSKADNTKEEENKLEFASTERLSPMSLNENQLNSSLPVLLPNNQRLASSYYDNLNTINSDQLNQKSNLKEINEPNQASSYDNIQSSSEILAEMNKKSGSLIQSKSLEEENLENLNEIIEKINQMQNIDEIERIHMANVEQRPESLKSIKESENSSISSLNQVDELIKSVIEQASKKVYGNANEKQSNKGDDNAKFLNDIIQQVNKAENQTEQLKKLDEIDFSWHTLVEGLNHSASGGDSIQPVLTENDENFIKIEDILIPKIRDDDTSKLEVDTISNENDIESLNYAAEDADFNWATLASNETGKLDSSVKNEQTLTYDKGIMK
jgi:hypothetical protein